MFCYFFAKLQKIISLRKLYHNLLKIKNIKKAKKCLKCCVLDFFVLLLQRITNEIKYLCYEKIICFLYVVVGHICS